MKKVVVVMTYYNRQYQLARTLESIRMSAYGNYEVIVVDDCSIAPPEIDVTDERVTVLGTKDKRWVNPEPAYNGRQYEKCRN